MDNIVDYYNRNRGMFIFWVFIFIFILLLFFGKKVKNDYKLDIKSIYNLLANQKKSKVTFGKNEGICKKVIETIFYPFKFNKIRPDFLKYKKGKNLEIDIYNNDLKFGVEVNGIQHYKHTPFFHRSYDEFLQQQERDEFKRRRCEEKGVTLIEVPYFVKPQHMANYIKSELRKKGIDLF